MKESIYTSKILSEVSHTVNTPTILIVEIGVMFCIRYSLPRQAEQVLIKLSMKMPNFSLQVLKFLGSYLQVLPYFYYVRGK